MDKQGNGLEIDQSNLGRCRSLGNVLTEEKFRYMCILSGCDYLPSLHGIGLSKACKVLRLAKDPDILKVSPDDEKVMLGFQRWLPLKKEHGNLVPFRTYPPTMVGCTLV